MHPLDRRLLLIQHDLKMQLLYRIPSRYHRTRGRFWNLVGRFYMERGYLRFHLRQVANVRASLVAPTKLLGQCYYRAAVVVFDFRWTRRQWRSVTSLPVDSSTPES